MPDAVYHDDSPRRRFAEMAARPDGAIDLVEAALLISAEENPGLDPRPTRELLERWSDELRPRLAGGDLERLQALCRFLFQEKGLCGDREAYYDPRNSFLDQVLVRRRGIPITLALVLLEVGRRVGVPLVGVGFPGHFLVRHGFHPQILLDPFDGGKLLVPEDCAGILARVCGDSIPFSARLLQPVDARQIVQRMLNNLCGIYLAGGALSRAVSVLDRILLLVPGDPRVKRARGLLRLKAGDIAGAVADLEVYLEAEPDASDWDDIAAVLEELREVAVRVN